MIVLYILGGLLALIALLALIDTIKLFFNMDKAVGKDFEEGLSKLKTIMES
ncbi:hypothetical protein [Gilvibacter sp.]|uniref:hypothetical protein n=1 Tax=Gilvibacter sp. TaxID=2729997 RepID=UPI0035BE68B8